ncbi:hypothetical protein M430DRAFT_160549 [Amorphotheca resinae ATCC 22711]|uniref:Uncharacterized protein n=1 Tax=Amorphotheca resinae ATCC 22711 TaxID=857342 RepID=A0A2T3BES1_AMORE|nr:hypothetical protein M430DRAFT_160549 [Amorphotheca resinae ATCC 22711]PSS27917.1 hypothetical protein M430DRAFT_160549 [Amorphotheca resinae ATCC 22711]
MPSVIHPFGNYLSPFVRSFVRSFFYPCMQKEQKKKKRKKKGRTPLMYKNIYACICRRDIKSSPFPASPPPLLQNAPHMYNEIE